MSGKEIETLSSLSFKKINDHLSTLKDKELEKIINRLDNAYYNSESLLSDERYDLLKEELVKRKGEISLVGAKMREGDNKAKLPFYLGSLDKIKGDEEEKLKKWVEKNLAEEYIVSEKLDGVSCMICSDSIFTRGDGYIGANISYLKKYILKEVKSLETVRGELLISKKDFKKYPEQSNPRNMVSGLVNSKTGREGLNDLQFVTYEIIDSGEQISPLEQLEKLREEGFKIPRYTILKELDTETLTSILISFKDESDFEIDGLVIQPNLSYFRNTSANPKYAFAFKVNMKEDMVECIVKKIHWNLSMRGILKPRVEIEGIKIDGVKINYATGFNGKFIMDNKLGKGSRILITRSGGVIPHIVKVIESTEAEMPEEKYGWSESKVDIFPEIMNKGEKGIKETINFLSVLDIKFVSGATVRKLYASGFDSLFKILKASSADFSEISGLGLKSGNRIYENIHSGLQNIKLYQLMSASNVFGSGFSLKKMKSLTKSIPNILTRFKKGDETLYQSILDVQGFSDKSCKRIYDNLPSFLIFLKKIKPYVTFAKKAGIVETNKVFSDKKIVFSGFRDKRLELEIEKRGGSVTTSVSKNTSLVVCADVNENSSKITKAKELGIRVINKEELLEIINAN